MSAILNSKIPETKRRMHRAMAVSLHRAGDTHVAIYQQTAPRDTGLMADTTHKEPEEVPTTDASHVELQVIAPQPYSGLVEFGTVHMEARPRFLPAFAMAVQGFKSEAKPITQIILKGGSVPLATVGIVRSVPQQRAPAVGAVRKVRGNE